MERERERENKSGSERERETERERLLSSQTASENGECLCGLLIVLGKFEIRKCQTCSIYLIQSVTCIFMQHVFTRLLFLSSKPEHFKSEGKCLQLKNAN